MCYFVIIVIQLKRLYSKILPTQYIIFCQSWCSYKEMKTLVLSILNKWTIFLNERERWNVNKTTWSHDDESANNTEYVLDDRYLHKNGETYLQSRQPYKPCCGGFHSPVTYLKSSLETVSPLQDLAFSQEHNRAH